MMNKRLEEIKEHYLYKPSSVMMTLKEDLEYLLRIAEAVSEYIKECDKPIKNQKPETFIDGFEKRRASFNRLKKIMETDNE